MSDRFWTTAEFAAFVRVPEATVHAWRYKGIAPPAYRVGKRLIWDKADVLTWLERHRDRLSADGEP